MRRAVLLLAGACVAAACQTSSETDKPAEKPDPRRGEQVRQVCFASQIRSWQPEGRRSVVVEKGVKDQYLLELIGPCQPQDAFTSIGLVSRIGGGSCLSEGDRLVTDARYNDGFCSIRAIYRWNPEARNTTPTE